MNKSTPLEYTHTKKTEFDHRSNCSFYFDARKKEWKSEETIQIDLFDVGHPKIVISSNMEMRYNLQLC